MLDFLFTPDSGTAQRSRRSVIVQRDLLRCNFPELRRLAARLGAGDAIVYAIRLDVPAMTRLVSLAMLRVRLGQIERTLASAGAQIVARYGVDPHLDAPACVYELHTPASSYADRNLRPLGRMVPLRRVAAWCFGCDPALGAIVLVARKS